MSEQTVRTICQRLELYVEWAIDRDLAAVPAGQGVLKRFIKYMESRGYKANTVRAYLWAISAVHKAFELQDPTRHPTVREEFESMRRRQEGRRPQQVLTLSEDDIRHILSELEHPRRTQFGRFEERGLAQKRAAVDAALLLTMTQAGLNRTQAQTLTWGDIREYLDGTGRITIPLSRTSKSVREYVVAVTPDCLWALEAIRPYDATENQGVFNISATQITKRLKAMCEAAGLDSANVNAHTPRKSLVRIMMENGAPFELIQRQSRWRTSSIAQAYIRDGEAGEVLDWMFRSSRYRDFR